MAMTAETTPNRQGAKDAKRSNHGELLGNNSRCFVVLGGLGVLAVHAVVVLCASASLQ
jgi:hypothetical protein